MKNPNVKNITKPEVLKQIHDNYVKKCNEVSDINELLPFLLKFAQDCSHITEMGVRNVCSTWAFLEAFPEKLVCYDLFRHENIDKVQSLAESCGVSFEFHEDDVLTVDIAPTDFLFIDTFHSAEQCRRELSLHSGKVRRYIGFHDTTTFWENAEPSYGKAGENCVNGLEGLRYAIEPFLSNNPEWSIVFRTEVNNGLLIIEKRG